MKVSPQALFWWLHTWRANSSNINTNTNFGGGLGNMAEEYHLHILTRVAISIHPKNFGHIFGLALLEQRFCLEKWTAPDIKTQKTFLIFCVTRAFIKSGLTGMFLLILVCLSGMIKDVEPSGLGSKKYTSTCETIPAEIHLTKGSSNWASSDVNGLFKGNTYHWW